MTSLVELSLTHIARTWWQAGRHGAPRETTSVNKLQARRAFLHQPTIAPYRQTCVNSQSGFCQLRQLCLNSEAQSSHRIKLFAYMDDIGAERQPSVRIEWVPGPERVKITLQDPGPTTPKTMLPPIPASFAQDDEKRAKSDPEVETSFTRAAMLAQEGSRSYDSTITSFEIEEAARSAASESETQDDGTHALNCVAPGAVLSCRQPHPPESTSSQHGLIVALVVIIALVPLSAAVLRTLFLEADEPTVSAYGQASVTTPIVSASNSFSCVPAHLGWLVNLKRRHSGVHTTVQRFDPAISASAVQSCFDLTLVAPPLVVWGWDLSKGTTHRFNRWGRKALSVAGMSLKYAAMAAAGPFDVYDDSIPCHMIRWAA